MASDPFDQNSPFVQTSALERGELLSGAIWAELRTFLAVAKAGSMTRASRLLGQSRMTTTRQLDRLQDEIGLPLVLYGRSGTVLTEKGRELARILSRVDRDIHATATDLRSETQDLQGEVRVTISDGLGMVFFAPALRFFSARHPGIAIHLKSPSNYRDIHENQTDMMLGVEALGGPDVTSRPVGFLHFITTASRAYLERNGLPTLDTIGDHTFVDCPLYGSAGAYGSWHDLTARGRVAYKCDTSISYGMMVKAGLGIGLLGNYIMLDPDFRPLMLDVHIPVRLYASTLTERLRSRHVEVVFDFLSSTYGLGNPWFAAEMNLDPSIKPVDERSPQVTGFRHL